MENCDIVKKQKDEIIMRLERLRTDYPYTGPRAWDMAIKLCQSVVYDIMSETGEVSKE